jgi:hypothetical protein
LLPALPNQAERGQEFTGRWRARLLPPSRPVAEATQSALLIVLSTSELAVTRSGRVHMHRRGRRPASHDHDGVARAAEAAVPRRRARGRSQVLRSGSQNRLEPPYLRSSRAVALALAGGRSGAGTTGGRACVWSAGGWPVRGQRESQSTCPFAPVNGMGGARFQPKVTMAGPAHVADPAIGVYLRLLTSLCGLVRWPAPGG